MPFVILSGVIGLAAAVAGVAAGAVAPAVAAGLGLPEPRGLATGPLVVLAATALLAASVAAARVRRAWQHCGQPLTPLADAEA